MVKPKDDVVVIVKVGPGNRDGLISVVSEDGEGAGRVKCQAFDGRGIDVMLIQDPVDGGADAAPDVVGRLFLFRTN